uniref:Amine oxidase domain-containing protein n=1 Tax=Odontella aurita TaxID=265563 RepID=A0A6U6GTW2_9STRA|mmetsp:Transcript_43435/g.132162  ORF Transcript_43435/g.132162 Transcript_43435/m.132162 type:complete len:532 (+) Transcript_43435:152-1747(+)
MIRTFDLMSTQQAQIWALVIATVVLLPIYFVLILTRWPKPRCVHPRRASSFRPDLVPKCIDTIVIGSGSGGCTCANLLAQSGQRVLLLERHEKTGGCTHSFREKKCEWDTGLHYTSKAMSLKTRRPGAIMDFLSRGKQAWTPLDEPYDEIVFPSDADTRPGRPNENSYRFISGKENTVESILNSIDPSDDLLRSRAMRYMDLCQEINNCFVALGVSRILPAWLSRILVGNRVDRLMKFAAMSVRDVQHAILNVGYTAEDLLEEGCPTAPEGPDPDPSIRRLKAVLTHPIGDYAVQPRDATFAAHGVTMTHYMGGASYTVGATQNISVKTSSLLREFGGEVFVDANVHGIIIEDGRAVGVRVSNEKMLAECTSEAEKASIVITEIRAKNVVCATSIYNLYNKLLPQNLPIVKKFRDPNKRTVRQSNGHVFLFCKIKGDATELGLPTHNLWYFNGYDLDGAFDEYFANPTEVRPPTVCKYDFATIRSSMARHSFGRLPYAMFILAASIFLISLIRYWFSLYQGHNLEKKIPWH